MKGWHTILVFLVVIRHHIQKQLEEECVYFILELVLSHPGKAGQGLVVGTKTELLEERYLLTFSS